MDDMALLCNLHADGPATLKVLRRTGIRTLPDVCSVDPRRLADTLGVSPAFARRFAREARLLAERMGAVALEAEEGALPVAPGMAGERSGADANPERVDTAPRADATRTDDARAYAPIVYAPAARAQLRELARAEVDAPAKQRLERTTIVPSTGTRLAHELIPGLDREWCDRLLAQGIRTLEELVAAPGLALARRLAMPFPRVLDLQYLAQRRLAEAAREESRTAAASDVAEPEYVLPPPSRVANAWMPATPQHEPAAWRADIGHLQPPLRTPAQLDSEVAGPFA